MTSHHRAGMLQMRASALLVMQAAVIAAATAARRVVVETTLQSFTAADQKRESGPHFGAGYTLNGGGTHTHK